QGIGRIRHVVIRRRAEGAVAITEENGEADSVPVRRRQVGDAVAVEIPDHDLGGVQGGAEIPPRDEVRGGGVWEGTVLQYFQRRGVLFRWLAPGRNLSPQAAIHGLPGAKHRGTPSRKEQDRCRS